jgi:hypothetical protein
VSKARNRNHPTSFLNTEVRLGKFFKTISTWTSMLNMWSDHTTWTSEIIHPGNSVFKNI